MVAWYEPKDDNGWCRFVSSVRSLLRGAPVPTPPPTLRLCIVAYLLALPVNAPGLAYRPARPVRVIVSRNGHVVVQQTKLGPHRFRFSLPSGEYRVTTDQSYVIPVNVVVHPGLVAHAAVLSTGCD
jgi:hypothetical protein